MEYRRLGNSGLKVSAIGLGGNTFGATADESGSVAVIKAAFDAGINYIDTADVYSIFVHLKFITVYFHTLKRFVKNVIIRLNILILVLI